MSIQRYTAWPEVGPFDAYYVDLREDAEGQLVLHDDAAPFIEAVTAFVEALNAERVGVTLDLRDAERKCRAALSRAPAGSTSLLDAMKRNA